MIEHDGERYWIVCDGCDTIGGPYVSEKEAKKETYFITDGSGWFCDSVCRDHWYLYIKGAV